MTIKELMRTDMTALHPEDSIATGWRSIRFQRLGGLPVIDDDGHVVGMLTEADLIARRLPPPRPRWWHLGFNDSRRLADHYRKTHGVTVGDVMTLETVAVTPEDAPDTAAARMHQHGLSTLPVVVDGHVVGVVARADLIGDLTCPPHSHRPAADADLVGAMRQRIDAEAWTSKHSVHVGATHGVLTLSGLVESQAERLALRAMARTITGCTEVDDHLLVRTERPAPRIAV